MKYRKKPVVIEAVQFIFTEEVMKFCGDKVVMQSDQQLNFRAVIKTLEGEMVANKGDWIIKGIKGEFYPCRADIFEATYEAVE